MEKLIRVIGPAPSEIPRAELRDRIRLEHIRVSHGLQEATAYTQKKKEAKKRKAPTSKRKEFSKSMTMAQFRAELAKKGLTFEEFEAQMKRLKEYETQKGKQ